MKKTGLFIFHRDFRIVDNVGLISASEQCEKLYTCFIFTPDQVGKANTFKSQNAVQFMIESLNDLKQDIRSSGGELMTFYGKQSDVIKMLSKALDINAVFFNKDYTPYATTRTDETVKLCESLKLDCQMFSDYYLFEPGTVLSGGKTAYKKYTPFYEAVVHKKVDAPTSKKIKNFTKTAKQMTNAITLEHAAKLFTKPNVDILVHGGRAAGLLRLKLVAKTQHKYDAKRDFFIENTTFLSAYLKFGCISVREAYQTFRHTSNGLTRELIWREFFAHVLYSYPEVVGKSYQPRYRHIRWQTSKAAFEKWKIGQTGFPIVDACMRQLNTTGYMHNRGRMTVASFLIKTLLHDWRLGEKYFAQRLTDYDVASNNGGWQGISGTGVDMKPYFRDMNPWIQQENFDKNCEFIKKWVPELADVDPKDIHKWADVWMDPKYKQVDYPKPMVDYTDQKAKMLQMYKDA